MSGPSRPVHYVLRHFPKLTETFVIDEILRLEDAGEAVVIDALEEPVEEPRHPGLDRLAAPVRYVPDAPSRGEVLRSHLPLALRRPRAWLRTRRYARAAGLRDEFRRAGIVARRTRRERARHVHTHFAYYCADVGGMAAALAGRPFTLTVHANDIWQEHSAPHLERRLSYARAVATVSEYNARHVRSLVPQTPVHVVRCAVAPAERAPAPADGPILTIGRFVPKKGIDLVIRALALLPPQMRLELIGEGHLEGELQALAESLAVADRVDFRGPQPPEAVAEAYSRCAVFCLPCRIAPDGDRDGLPVVFLEAMARGLPVVTTDAFPGELVEDGVTGRIVAGESPAALAAGIAELVEDRELARTLGERARRLMREEVTEDAAAAALRRLFDAAG